MIGSAILTWKERQRTLFVAVPMTLLPAVAILPAMVYLVFIPAIPHGPQIALLVVPMLGLLCAQGIILLVRTTLDAGFDLITAIASSAFMFLVIIGFYTGLILAAFVLKR